MANPVKWFSVLACCSSDAVQYDTYGGGGGGGCSLDPWVIGGKKIDFSEPFSAARDFIDKIHHLIHYGKKNNGFPTTACVV